MRPVIAIVGRPNVGKSTLLNRLAGRQVAVVEDEPGVTRDRLFADARLGQREVVLVDTGGLEPDSGDALARAAVEQAHLAVAESDLVLFLCDGRAGLHPQDQQVADVLRHSGKPFLCLINKVDPGAERREWEFYELGLDLLPISAAHGSGLDALADAVAAALDRTGFPQPVPERPAAEAEAGPLRLSLLGRPNVGKSSLANRLLGDRRQLVSEIAGTTRDAVDIPFERGDRRYLLVDTPGLRRRRSIALRLERTSALAALRSLERTDAAVVVLDGSQPFADQDARLLRLVHERGRALVVAINKCDLWDPERKRDYGQQLRHGMRFVDYAPVVALSAVTGRGVQRLLPEVDRAHAAGGVRLGTGELNRWVEEALERHPPPVIKGRRGKIFYVTQAGVHPPTFVAWVNDPARFSESYRRYLDHQLRERFHFRGTPLVLRLRRRGQPKGGRGAGRSRSGKRGGRR